MVLVRRRLDVDVERGCVGVDPEQGVAGARVADVVAGDPGLGLGERTSPVEGDGYVGGRLTVLDGVVGHGIIDDGTGEATPEVLTPAVQGAHEAAAVAEEPKREGLVTDDLPECAWRGERATELVPARHFEVGIVGHPEAGARGEHARVAERGHAGGSVFPVAPLHADHVALAPVLGREVEQ